MWSVLQREDLRKRAAAMCGSDSNAFSSIKNTSISITAGLEGLLLSLDCQNMS